MLEPIQTSSQLYRARGRILSSDTTQAGVDRPWSAHASSQAEAAATAAAAGHPSMHLMERMSSAVRRLENAKTVLVDELARCSMLRDEARIEVACLMSDAKKQLPALQECVCGLERDCNALYVCYQTTLEMLGKKSEWVEELLADVVNLKAIYHQLLLDREREQEQEQEQIKMSA
ncbi:MAG: hypothetical protein M1826_001307 [Phylliscum demangeonii]|nr:MAG: hypothetical protein M1826_001307 [Phylliscum demangeonii]